MTVGYYVDAAKRCIMEVEYQDHRDIRALVTSAPNQSFTLGHFIGANTLYVCDNGLYSRLPGFFRLVGSPNNQPIRGNGLLVGPETPDGGDRPPTITLANWKAHVEFLTWDEACAWVAARADKAAMSINGEVIMTWAEFWREVPAPFPSGGGA
jgi:hypothetical protein